MKLFGIGMDIVEVERVLASMEEFGDRFVEKIFTQVERDYCEGQKRPAIHYAARFAAKEAVAKAFGTGIGKELGWLDVEVMRLPSGEPEVVLTGNGKIFAQKHGVSQIKVSLSHTEHYAAANAVVMVD